MIAQSDGIVRTDDHGTSLTASLSSAPRPDRRIGLALSGGGFRAASFHLGVLKRLEELGVLAQVDVLSCVSGGAITGALYALRCSQRGNGRAGSYPVDSLIGELRPVLTSNLRGRALFGSPVRALRALWSVVSHRVSRVGLMVGELDRQLFGNAMLSQLPSWIVINATNLRTGKGWKFYSDRAGDFLIGATEQTSTVRVADAVAASAAYPGLTDSFAFRTRWEELRGNLLDENRWDRPPVAASNEISHWRSRFGQPTGRVDVPLVDGGLYDNEGINSLRGAGVTHAIISGVAPPEGDSASGFTPWRYLQIVGVLHGRLGAATRQLAHEMTHGEHPAKVREQALSVAVELRDILGEAGIPGAERKRLAHLADAIEQMGAVGSPPRGHQFRASAQILLHRIDVANNAFSRPERGGYDVPPEFRGLDAELVDELSRVRTDLDALHPRIVDLLIAQGYFLTDFLMKLTMPDLVVSDTPKWYAPEYAPRWAVAHNAIREAIQDRNRTSSMLRAASSRDVMFGYDSRKLDKWRHQVSLSVAVLCSLLAVSALGWLTQVGLRFLFKPMR